MHALVVDDSRAIRVIIGRLIKSLGYEVVEAGNGQEALAALEGCSDPRLALVDWNMPVMNGLEFVQAVRSNPRWAELNLVMVTTESELAQVQRALEAGANEYVMKPFTVDVLRDKLTMLGLTTGGDNHGPV
jgi:two-component system, chemotaxis family, chemotaxis protein CheY